MKFDKFFSVFLLLFLSFFPKRCESIVYDGSTYNVYIDNNTIFKNGDNAIGSVAFRGGATVPTGTGVRLNIDVPLYNYLDLRSTGSLTLEGDLFLDSNISLSSGGIIGLDNHSLLLNGNLQIPDNSVFEFASSGIFDGQGHDVILGKYAQLLVDGGVTVTFKNMTIRNTLNTISCPPIRCMDWYSQACFDNVIFAFNDDWAFRNGQFFIYNDVEFTGTSKFSYRSVRPSYITSHSNLIFDPQTTFEFYPSTTDNKLIQMADKTSAIIFDGSTLQTTHTGIRLTKGSIYFDNNVTLSSALATYPTQGYLNSIIFGNSITGSSQDLDVYLLGAARVGIYGKVWQDSVNRSWNFQSRDSYVSLDRYDSEFKITNAASMEDWKKNQIIKSSAPNALFLQDNQVWATNMDQFAPEETFEFMNNLIIPDGQLIEFSANAVVDGQGHDLILGKYSQLLVDGGVTVTFKNMTIRNTLNTISRPPIHCMDWDSQTCFDNVTFALNDDWAFRNGQFFIHNDVEFTGISKFSYRSLRPSYLASHSNLIFDPNTTFEYYPSTVDNALIRMTNKTSAIMFDGSTLQTTHTGIRLTQGSIYFDNKVTLSSAGNTLLALMDLGIGSSIYFGNMANSVDWSLNGKYLATARWRIAIIFIYEWDGSTLTLKDSKNLGDYVNSVNWSPDGKFLAVGGVNVSTADVIIYEWDGSTLTLKDSKSFGNMANSVNWSPDGKFLAVGGWNNPNDVIIYEWDGSILTLKDSKSFGAMANSVNWSPDGKFLAVGGDNGSTDIIIYEWNGSILTLKDSKSFGNEANSVNWSPDGKFLAVGGDNGSTDIIIYEWNGSTLTLKDSKSFGTMAHSVNWSPDGKYLAVGGYNGLTDLIIYEWNGSTLIQKISKDFGDGAYSVDWDPDVKYLAVGGDNNLGNVIIYGVNYSFDTTPQGYLNSIIFGNSALGSDFDVDIHVLSRANVNIFGKVWYDDVN